MPKLKYRYDWKVIANKARSQHQIDTKMGSVEDAVNKLVAEGKMQDPYEKYRAMENRETETELHASRGKKLEHDQNRNVLEFEVGGSGYLSPQAIHGHFGGKNDVVDNGGNASIPDIKEKKTWKVHFWNKIRLFQLLPPGIRPKTEDEILKHNAIVEKYSQNMVGGVRKKGQQSKLDYLFEQRYGKNSTLDSLKDKKEIYVKEHEPTIFPNGVTIRRTRYSMPGPQGTFLGMGAGVSNSGKYSIQNLSQYMLDAGKAYLTPLFEEWAKKESEALQVFTQPEHKEDMETSKAQAKKIRSDIHPVSILLRGHSRGGVAISHGAMRIKDWIHNEYPQFEKYVNFETIQLDPVAGYGSDHGVKRNINLNNEKRPELQQEMKERGMRSLGKAAQTTVVYSLHTDHGHFFSPQIVDGAKRVILTTGKHSVNLEKVDSTQQKDWHGNEKSSQREGYMDAETGHMYRNSGLNELPEGIYIADEKNRLIRIPNAEVGKALLKDVLKDVSGQKGRHNRIQEVMDNWFKANENQMDKDSQPSRERIQAKDLQKEHTEERQSIQPRVSMEPSRAREQKANEKRR